VADVEATGNIKGGRARTRNVFLDGMSGADNSTIQS